jgi:hypothetical protein
VADTTFRGRTAVTIENAGLRVTVLHGGGHIAEILDKRSGMNPLWIPPWPSIEPASYRLAEYPEYGDNVEAKLLASIMGHNLCMDIFGGPSPEEAAVGIAVHGEGAVAAYDIEEANGQLTMRAHLPIAQLVFERRIELRNSAVKISESVENLCGFDRPIFWTQHVTLGPPFLERGRTEFRVSATRSKVWETDFGVAAYLKAAAEFDWPMAPRQDQGFADLSVFNASASSSAFTAQLMDPRFENAFFLAFAPAHRLAFGYVWKREDFPWMGIWEENHSRVHAPWNGKALTRGMEFGASPYSEPRRQAIDRGTMFGVPTYRWLPAKGRLNAGYWAIMQEADSIPESLEWPG